VGGWWGWEGAVSGSAGAFLSPALGWVAGGGLVFCGGALGFRECFHRRWGVSSLAGGSPVLAFASRLG